MLLRDLSLNATFLGVHNTDARWGEWIKEVRAVDPIACLTSLAMLSP